MRIMLEFSGGLDVLFDGKKEQSIELNDDGDQQQNWTVKRLLEWIMEKLLRGNDRADMLIQKGTVRPGVLMLVNQIDWEILGALDAPLSDGDTVTFISTLHGG